MQKNILNYRILIEKEKSESKKNTFVYNAYCLTLGISDFGNTIDQAVKRVTKLIKFHIDSLIELGYEVPIEKDETTVITSIDVPISFHTKFSYV